MRSTLAFECCLNLEADEIVRVFETPCSIDVGDVDPRLTNESEQYVARSDGLGDLDHEVFAELYVVDVLEDLLGTEPLDKAVVQRHCWKCGVLPPVTDEYPSDGRTVWGIWRASGLNRNRIGALERATHFGGIEHGTRGINAYRLR